MPHCAADVAERLYIRWNEDGVAALTECVDPEVELICDPLRPDESALRGLEGWREWVARWDGGYETMQITTDGVIPMGDDHALALVSITATPRGGREPLRALSDPVGVRGSGWAPDPTEPKRGEKGKHRDAAVAELLVSGCAVAMRDLSAREADVEGGVTEEAPQTCCDVVHGTRPSKNRTPFHQARVGSA